MEVFVKIRAGYDIAFQCPYAVPMVLMLTTHPSRDGDILGDQSMSFSPGVRELPGLSRLRRAASVRAKKMKRMGDNSVRTCVGPSALALGAVSYCMRDPAAPMK